MIPQLQRDTPVASPPGTTQWSLATRIGFRFVFSYFLLYLGPGAVGALGLRDRVISTPYRAMWMAIWHSVVPWVGENLLHLKGDFREIPNGSGDELYDYILVLCICVLAVVVTAVWSWMDRRRPNYQRLHAWLRLLMRLSIAAPMIGYGVNKLFQAQFPEPPLVRLIDPLGQTSPMGFLWTFMGYSRAYSFFGGLGETLGGVLILVPQFTALASLITIGVMSNVFMLNMCYDVPRKIYSIHIILICTFLLLPELRRLANLFVFNRTAEPALETPLFTKSNWNRLALLFQIGYGVLALSTASYQARQDEVKYATHLSPAVRGIWYVDDFTLDNVPHLPLLTDKERWKQVVLDTPNLINVQMMDETLQQYPLRLDEQQNTLRFADIGSPHWKGEFTIEHSQPDSMTLTGEVDDRPMVVHLRRLDIKDPNKFLLINRGFHWVNQFTYRR
ncbi:MAG TPA: DoxX family protein [Chloroflexota bacterium]|nr:DoxX family protein [Chloroflexota bacterium]